MPVELDYSRHPWVDTDESKAINSLASAIDKSSGFIVYDEIAAGKAVFKEPVSKEPQQKFIFDSSLANPAIWYFADMR